LLVISNDGARAPKRWERAPQSSRSGMRTRWSAKANLRERLANRRRDGRQRTRSATTIWPSGLAGEMRGGTTMRGE
jgi:hypothetical protein